MKARPREAEAGFGELVGMYMRAFAETWPDFVQHVGGDEFFIDLLFYHLKLRRYFVIELKGGKFKPEHIGQLGFYLEAIDSQVKAPDDAPTIGLLLCKTKNQIVAEYALRTAVSPIGLAGYKLMESLPKDLEVNLPSVARIEEELREAPMPAAKPRARSKGTAKGA